MGQRDEFAASSLVVRPAARNKPILLFFAATLCHNPRSILVARIVRQPPRLSMIQKVNIHGVNQSP